MESKVFDIFYSWVFTFPNNDIYTFHYFFISTVSCRSGPIGTTGVNKCFNGIDGCAFTPFQTLIVDSSTQKFKISSSNKYIFTCTQQTINIYIYSGSSYSLYQSIYIRLPCNVMAFNKDYSIMAINRLGS